MKVLIDNGHGIETLGKRSPDGRLREYAYTREIADRVVKALTAAGIDAVRIVPEDADVPLSERCTRANAPFRTCGLQIRRFETETKRNGKRGKRHYDMRPFAVRYAVFCNAKGLIKRELKKVYLFCRA